MNDPVLETWDLQAGYGSRIVLREVNLTLRAGELVTLVGVNGAGKSTLLKTLIGTTPVMGGEIVLRGCRVAALPAFRRVAAGIAFSPEGRRIFANMTVEGNLLVGAACRDRGRERDQLSTVLNLFPELAQRLDQRGGTLSGGEQQMLAIGRALMAAPHVLLVEEPSQGLAPVVVDRVYAALRSLTGEGVAVLVAEQFQQVREDASDRVVIVDAGRLWADEIASATAGRPNPTSVRFGTQEGS